MIIQKKTKENLYKGKRIYIKYLNVRKISLIVHYQIDQIMQRKRSTNSFCNQDDAQPWDSYVTGTTNDDSRDDKKDKRPKR